jgi:hypothetical protein
MSFLGVVTKAGFMNKTATVTVSRWVIDKRTGKVCDDDQTSNTASTSPQNMAILAHFPEYKIPGAR